MIRSDGKPRQVLVAAASVLTIIGSSLWFYFSQFAKPLHNEALHLGIGRAMAEETSKLLGHKGHIVIVAMETSKVPELKVQLAEFEKTLSQLGTVRVDRTFVLDTEDKPKYAIGAGLSARRFLRIVKKSEKANAIVSFVGVPSLSKDDLAQLNLEKMPKLIAEVRSAEKIKDLFEKKVIQVAIVSRFQFPSPGTRKPRTPGEWFTNRLQIVTAASLAALPEP